MRKLPHTEPKIRLSFYLPKKTGRALGDLARQRGTTKAGLIREALLEYVALQGRT